MRKGLCVVTALAAMLFSSASAMVVGVIGDSRDERPPVSDEEAETNFTQARPAVPEDARVFDFRNGQFVVVGAPYWRGGSCTVRYFVDRYGRPPRFEHAEMSEGECVRELETFRRPGTALPFEGRSQIMWCDSGDAIECAEAREELRALAERAATDESVLISGPLNGPVSYRSSNIEAFASMIRRQRVLLRTHGFPFGRRDRWRCVGIEAYSTVAQGQSGGALACSVWTGQSDRQTLLSVELEPTNY